MTRHEHPEDTSARAFAERVALVDALPSPGRMGETVRKWNPFQRMQGSVGPAIFALFSFMLLLPFARLDFNRQHDGVMLAQAIAVHQGASANSDVFSQYGPFTPWLQSLALFLPMGPGMALRTLNAVFIAVTVFLLADMGRRSPRGWPISRAVGWWSAIAWVVLADIWLGIAMLPWSSTLAAMLSVATLYFLMSSIRHAEDGCMRPASITALAGGVSLGLIPFTRINVGLSSLVVGLFVAGLIIIVERDAKRMVAKLYILGTLLSLLTVFAILIFTNSMADFYYQSIKWPLTWGQTAVDAMGTQQGLKLIFSHQSPPVALVCAAIFLQFRARTKQRRWSVAKSTATTFTWVVGLIIVIWENLAPTDRSGTTLLKSISSYRFLNPTASNNHYLHFFLVLSVAASMMTCLFLVWRFFRDGDARNQLIPWIILVGLTLSGLTQIIPTYDTRHIWWGVPVGLLLIFAIVRSTSNLSKPSGNPVMIPLFMVTVMAIVSGSVYWGSERVEGRPGTIIEGMLVSKTMLAQINQDTDFLRENLQGTDSVVYLVTDGDVSVLDMQYRSADAYFVNWGGPPQIGTRLTKRNPIVVQTITSIGPGLSESSIDDLARSMKYKVVARNQRLVVLMPIAAASS